MSIPQGETLIKRVGAFFERRDVFIVLVIVLVGFSGFGLGKLSSRTEAEPPVRIEYREPDPITRVVEKGSAEEQAEAAVADTGLYVGSRNSDKYHYPWCPGAERIKEENKVWFSNREEAEAAGYVPAKNCKGLE